MKTAHIKTVDGTTTMIQFKDEGVEQEFICFLAKDNDLTFAWGDGPADEMCVIFKHAIISVRFREVE